MQHSSEHRKAERPRRLSDRVWCTVLVGTDQVRSGMDMVCYICQGVFTKQLLCAVFDAFLTPFVPYLCAFSFKLVALAGELHPFNHSNIVACCPVCCTLLECLAPIELEAEREDHFFSLPLWDM